jgi:hypothetical protein
MKIIEKCSCLWCLVYRTPTLVFLLLDFYMCASNHCHCDVVPCLQRLQTQYSVTRVIFGSVWQSHLRLVCAILVLLVIVVFCY